MEAAKVRQCGCSSNLAAFLLWHIFSEFSGEKYKIAHL
jgi:hypothetical protein